jgi:hypothetical protein
MSRMESADDYSGLVIQLNSNWRIVECRDRLQWILQHRGSPKKSRRDDWRGRSYCQTSEALRRCTREHAGVIDPSAAAVLAALPERIDAPLTQQIGGAESCEMFANDGRRHDEAA